jgi:hypothetical protein
VPREYEPLPTPPTSPKGSRNERPHQQVLVGGAEGAPAWPDLALYAQVRRQQNRRSLVLAHGCMGVWYVSQ